MKKNVTILIVGNFVASVILSRKEMRNAFNLLLLIMACFDSTYLFGSILESFRKEFHLATNPNSAVAVNLKACNHYRLYNGKAAEAELKVLADSTSSGNINSIDNDLVRYVRVVVCVRARFSACPL